MRFVKRTLAADRFVACQAVLRKLQTWDPWVSPGAFHLLLGMLSHASSLCKPWSSPRTDGWILLLRFLPFPIGSQGWHLLVTGNFSLENMLHSQICCCCKLFVYPGLVQPAGCLLLSAVVFLFVSLCTKITPFYEIWLSDCFFKTGFLF